MKIEHTESADLDLAAVEVEQLDEQIKCELEEEHGCQNEATHRLLHKVCGGGALICTYHAECLMRIWPIIEWLLGTQNRMCFLCRKRILDPDEIEVVAL